ncbi:MULTISPECIES: DUF4255 domain-containing protein [Nocardioides]|uniref:DUF4255 domain-containing protein n=1 Tax=Nocardioides vastitatis TaxID=2568655 RepID=A0ABW0ZKC0_9ACTN|nr:DUF4255 domain-containing protein [Nocardioides sp.]THI97397.1 DUF4255 domain-containing protein [Nocardioides sp.]
MLSQVDDALREIVRGDAVDADIDVVFDAPTKDWAARRNAPTVNLYLYDIREDTKHRATGFLERLDDTGRVVARIPAPRFFKLSYLVTAWTQRPEDEHRLLDGLLRAFIKYDALPDHLVVGPLAEPHEPVKVTIGLPPPEDRAFADVWSALGGELKPSLDLVVVAPVFTGKVYEAGPPVDEGLVIDTTDLVNGGTGRRQAHVPPPPSQEAAARLGLGDDAGETSSAAAAAGRRSSSNLVNLGKARPRGRSS